MTNSKAKRSQRTDAHRPGAIIPANYDQWNDYSLAGSDGCPAFGLDCAQPYNTYDGKGRCTGRITPVCPDTGRCCVASTERHARAEGRAIFGSRGKCGVCGACFRHGSMFRHEATGEIVHMGHDCAQKYEMMADLSAHEIALGRVERAHAVAIERDRKAQARADFLAKHEGLEAALAVEHRIIADIAARFTQFASLSDKQVALVLKLANEVQNPAPAKPEEKAAVAPTGKGVQFEGEIVSAKLALGDWGSSWKITVKVTTDDGVWLAWGTAPASILDEARKRAQGTQDAYQLRTLLVGSRVAIKATLERPAANPERDNRDNFVFMKRPTGQLVVQP